MEYWLSEKNGIKIVAFDAIHAKKSCVKTTTLQRWIRPTANRTGLNNLHLNVLIVVKAWEKY